MGKPNEKRLTYEQVKEAVKEAVIEVLGVNEEQIKDDSDIIEDLGADSLDTVELIMEFEKAFEITIPDEDASEKIATVGDAVKYIEEKLG